MNTIALQTWFSVLWPQLLFVLALVLLDMISGALVARKRGIFKWERFPEGLRLASGYLVSWLSVELVAILPTILNLSIAPVMAFLADYAPVTIYVGVVVKYLAGLGTNVKELTSGQSG